MKNHISNNPAHLLTKIIFLRKENRIKDKTTARQIIEKLKSGTIELCGERFTLIQEQKQNI
jgi:RNA-binding protein YhbY